MSQTITEKILAKAAHKKAVHPGDNIWVDVNVLMTHDVCGPGMISVFHKKFGKDAERIRILYGGSVDQRNVNDYLTTTGIDGALVGGASLDPRAFGLLCRAALPA
jgi:hypothetical protein